MRPPQFRAKRPVTRFITGLAAVGALAVSLTVQAAGVPAAQEVDWLSRLAHQGDAGAELQLGLAYLEGRYGLHPDPLAARRWLDAAAKDGNAYAAAIERRSPPVPEVRQGGDSLAAVAHRLDMPGLNALLSIWHTVAISSPSTYSRDALLERAHQGDPLAEYQLGLRYRNGGWAVEPDARQARRWLRKAAADGNRLAAQALTENRPN